MNLIGLSGKMGVGKTTVANMIKELVPGTERVAFGDLLKREVAERFDIPLAVFYHDKNKRICANPQRFEAGWPGTRSVMTARELLQWYCTDLVRAQNPDYWTVAMREHLRTLRGVPLVVIDDVRFPNEANFIKESSGMLVRIEAYPGYTVSADVAGHASETALDDWQTWDMVFRPELGEEALLGVAEGILKHV
ncbi:hypothetical protein LJC59_00860 [Desulfovibrio sp. OttesenSCG-928-A18]|nr:hypothetical protein [Desulfovibrio sp. OttesenSCG-928-A18]